MYRTVFAIQSVFVQTDSNLSEANWYGAHIYSCITKLKEGVVCCTTIALTLNHLPYVYEGVGLCL